jgi:hypothetical protein
LEDTPKTPIEDKAMIKTEDMQAYATNLQAISTSITSYTKKSFEDGSAFFEKLAGAKSFDKVLELQQDYAKSAYEAFVGEATKISEFYTGLAKDAAKPFEAYMPKMK